MIAYLGQYLYEYHKGVRHLFMLTMTPHEAMAVQKSLERESIPFHIQKVSVTKVNVFFGRDAYIQTIRTIVTRPLYELTPEQDFMLGTLLGYDREQQCLRYLNKSRDNREISVNSL
ncbi:hypothetical protein ZMO02_17170 [Zymomonas mobilis subsp. pomaceae]|uniref:DUF2023 domain-containing protein n=2 Tax=Zymomonas mobilis TaxID=542 RepID=F8EUE0_ZYMMT|nr:Domain of unknown function DUF2023 [Zymomonas mobilis subsp. pomaceae ATCC 29192]GEB90080.1 hypothetical protein ZMO02_17170 [Zymomonas mobilis subsp. pomaceae]